MRGELTPNTTPLASVIVPVYNVRPYLDQCLASIAAQTYANIEVIVVDDGSTDGGGAVCDGWAAKDPRFRVIHQQNRGLSAARNAGLDAAQGEYIQFVDSDDYVAPRFTEALLQAARETGCPCAICGYETHRASGTDGTIPTAQPVVINSHDCLQRMLAVRAKDQYRIGYTAWNRIYRRSLLFEHGIRFPEGRVYEDVWITAPVMHHSEEVTLIPDVLYHKNDRDGSISHDPSEQNLADHVASYEALCANVAKRFPDLLPLALAANERVRIFSYLHLASVTTNSGKALERMRKDALAHRRDLTLPRDLRFALAMLMAACAPGIVPGLYRAWRRTRGLRQ